MKQKKKIFNGTFGTREITIIDIATSLAIAVCIKLLLYISSYNPLAGKETRGPGAM